MSRIRVDDVDLVVDRSGEGGRPLLLVHGFGGCREDFSPVTPALVAAGWDVVAPDHRGHGDSDHPPDEEAYGIDRLAADMLGLVDELGWSRFVLLGHSLGGAVAQRLVLEVPERIEALILMSTTPGPIGMDPELLQKAAAIIRRDGLDRYVDLMNERPDPLGSPARDRTAARIPGYLERGERNVRRCSGAMYARMLDELRTRPDLSAELTGVRCPTLVLVGDEDHVMLDPSHRLAELIPGARLAVIPDAGHNPQWENTEAYTAELLGFLGGV